MDYHAPIMTDTPNQSEVHTDQAPAPVGPYSQAITLGNLIFLSGQIPLDPKTGDLVPGDIEEQTRQILRNLAAVLEAAGSGLSSVVKTTVYLTDMSAFPRVNAIYAEAFEFDPAPARATVEVSALPLGARVEIDAIAFIRS